MKPSAEKKVVQSYIKEYLEYISKRTILITYNFAFYNCSAMNKSNLHRLHIKDIEVVISVLKKRNSTFDCSTNLPNKCCLMDGPLILWRRNLKNNEVGLVNKQQNQIPSLLVSIWTFDLLKAYWAKGGGILRLFLIPHFFYSYAMWEVHLPAILLWYANRQELAYFFQSTESFYFHCFEGVATIELVNLLVQFIPSFLNLYHSSLLVSLHIYAYTQTHTQSLV